MDKEKLENTLRSSKVSTLRLIKNLVESPVVVSTATGGNVSVYQGPALGGQYGTLSRMKVAQRLPKDEDNNQQWELNPDIDKKWLKKLLVDLRI